MKTSLPSFFIFKIKRYSRRGVSPVIATTIILAITVALGLALWGFANSGVGTATTQYSQTVDKYGEFVGDKFVIANVAFDNPGFGEISFWVFNSGELPTTISNIILTCRDPCGDVSNVGLSDSVTIPSKELTKITFDLSSPVKIENDSSYGDKTYELTVVSATGATQDIIVRSN
jgi:flagellin-like protein